MVQTRREQGYLRNIEVMCYVPKDILPKHPLCAHVEFPRSCVCFAVSAFQISGIFGLVGFLVASFPGCSRLRHSFSSALICERAKIPYHNHAEDIEKTYYVRKFFCLHEGRNSLNFFKLEANICDQGPVSRKPRKHFGPGKP